MAIDFTLTPDQERIRDEVRKLAEATCSPGARERDSSGDFHWDGWRALGKWGFLGMHIPEDYGGGGQDILTTMSAIEGFGLGCRDGGLSLSVLAHMIICQIPIWLYGTEAQRRAHLPKLTTGEFVGAFALTEPNAGSDAQSIRTTWRRDGDRYVLNGTKTFCTNGPIADRIVVFATSDPKRKAKGFAAFIVEKGMPGFTVGRELDKMGDRSSPTGELVFEDAVVPAANLLGAEGQGWAIALETLNWERALMPVARLGAMQHALEVSIAYAKAREQFGRPIADFQAIQHRLADMKLRVEIGRLLAYKVAWQKQQGVTGTVDASLAKLFLSEAAIANYTDAMRIHGGWGYMREFDVERGLRDAMLGVLGGGTSDIQKMIIARHLLQE